MCARGLDRHCHPRVSRRCGRRTCNRETDDGYREDERRRALGDGLITIISAYQMGSDEGVVAGLLEVERVGTLWLLGLRTGVDDAIL